MAFCGCEFIFDGISCFEYGLVVYDFGSINEDGKFSSGVEIVEDRTSWRYTPLHYGVTQHEALTFSFTFGADPKLTDIRKPLDRWEMNVVASWLTGSDTYKYLEVVQPDMEAVRYKCIITELEYVTYGKAPWAFKCTVTCDSPFAYLYPSTDTIEVSDSMGYRILNRASSRYYYPKLTISKNTGCTSISIKNHSDNDREFLFSSLTEASIEIYVDSENEVITSSEGTNLYNNFNFKFFRLVRGYNELEITGNASIDITCEYPINIGG